MSANRWNVAIVADDLTGAGDTAVQFAAQGWSAVVTPRAYAEPDGQHEIVAVTTGVRAHPAAEAEAATVDAVWALRDVPFLYLKVDSALRGSVAAQVAGVLRARPDAVAVVCPAYPAMGRTVAKGRVYMHGEPIDQGPAGRDPVTPVTTSRLAGLLPGSEHLSIDELAKCVQKPGARVFTVDAENDADLGRLGAVIAGLGERAIPVGSAGLAGVLANRWRTRRPAARPGPDVATVLPGSGPIGVLVSSQHAVARLQTNELRKAYAGKIVEVGLGTREPVPAAELVLVRAPDDITADGQAAGYAAAAMANRLADAMARSHERARFAAFILTGGDGAGALLDRFGCTGISVRGRVDEGIPCGRAIGGVVNGLPMVTKAGGFGGPGALVDAVRHLRGERGATA